VRQLAVSGDGTCAFVNRDGAAVVAPLARPAEARTGLLRADALRADGSKAGSVVATTTVRLAGDWLVAGVDLLTDGGARTRAVVLAGRDDLAAGRAQILLEQGALLPSSTAAAPAGATPPAPPPPAPTADGGPATPRRVKSLFFDDGHEEPLWHPG
jgi:hypothetical protein